MAMRDHIYNSLHRQFRFLAERLTKEEWGEFDGMLWILAGQIAATGIKSWPPNQVSLAPSGDEGKAQAPERNSTLARS
jgi:hypothetical protein